MDAFGPLAASAQMDTMDVVVKTNSLVVVNTGGLILIYQYKAEAGQPGNCLPSSSESIGTEFADVGINSTPDTPG